LRRETEESLELAGTAQPTDLESVLRMREESVNRQNDTNMRILATMTPHLTAEQTKALRTQFESGHTREWPHSAQSRRRCARPGRQSCGSHADLTAVLVPAFEYVISGVIETPWTTIELTSGAGVTRQ
jgi:hypothetical protein